MGVTGLWRLIEPAGKPVPVETLENKVLAVDISIWLHQMVKGYQDAKGAPLPNAHLMGLFQRLCKLLYFRIKPVFVFDGGFPDLKKETIAKRQNDKAKYHSESERIKRELALLLSKKSAISNLLGKEISPKKANSSDPANDDDLFKLPALPVNKEESESESEDEHSSSSSSILDMHSVDIESEKFKSLPVKEKYDLLIELKETRKMNSWGKIHELPKKSDNFSDFQMQRLLKRRKVQECLEETEKEMGDGGMSLIELESLLNEEGIDTKIESIPTRRIASNNTTRYLLINNVKEALLEAKKKKEAENQPGPSKDSDKEKIETEQDTSRKNELEDDMEKAIKMSLECHDTSNFTSKTDDSWTSIMTDSEYSEHTDSEEGDGYEQPDMSSAKAYIMQYSDLTNKAIEKIVTAKSTTKNNSKPSVDIILEELNKEKSVIVDNINLSSDEECKSINKIEDNSSDEFTAPDVTESTNDVADIDATQSSVIYVENIAENIISLDSSTDENIINNDSTIESLKIESNTNDEMDHLEAIKIKNESDSDDDEFEDVPEIENETKRTVVQLTLDMNQKCDEDDDIFADIFTNKDKQPDKSETVKIDILSTKSEIKEDDEQVSNKYQMAKNDISYLRLAYNNPEKEASNKNDIETNLDRNQVIKNPNEVKEDASVCVTSSKQVDKINSLNKRAAENIQADKDDRNNENDFSVDVPPVVNSPLLHSEQESCDKITTEIKSIKDPSIENNEQIDKNRKIMKETISKERLTEMAEKVASEEQDLMQEKGRLDRIGRNITEQMTKEAQELLQIFGIPYIVAPMEAEAQCAFLENLKLTDGTITDDSDIWLFGGRTVYKNFFNQKKHVLQFLSERIERSFNLTREQLILLALLVGSDYTTGVDGVGPVTAMEILASFPFNKKKLLNETSKQARYQAMINGLEEFKTWVRSGKRTDNTSLKKKLKNVNLSDDFPSVRVVQAYLEPNVEKSGEKFTWGELDITILRDYTKAKFGWSQNKLDEIINPVMKRMLERKSQKTVHDYFKRKVEFQPLDDQMSKRVKAAVQKMGPEPLINDESLNSDIPTKQPRKRKPGSNDTQCKAGPSKPSKASKKISEINESSANLLSQLTDGKSAANIMIPKSDRFQEIIPQREKDKQSLLQNKLKAIEVFRKTNIDRKKKLTKKKVILPKEKADLSESSDDE